MHSYRRFLWVSFYWQTDFQDGVFGTREWYGITAYLIHWLLVQAESIILVDNGCSHEYFITSHIGLERVALFSCLSHAFACRAIIPAPIPAIQ